MRNRELFLKKLDQLEGQISMVKSFSRRPNATIQELDEILIGCKELINDMKSQIQREPLSGNELNIHTQG